MFLLLTVGIVLFYEILTIYNVFPTTLIAHQRPVSNCISEKWGLLYWSIRDRVFSDNYRYHVDSTDEQTLNRVASI